MLFLTAGKTCRGVIKMKITWEDRNIALKNAIDLNLLPGESNPISLDGEALILKASKDGLLVITDLVGNSLKVIARNW
jgi:hypothetical protein